ncbi:MAG: PadR family transcriptional regulator [Candidatus Bathyarchaeia archaeon]
MSKENYDICPPECCDMRGMLSFLILWLLSKKPMYGQELAEEIGKRRGTKPNPGTIYPALKQLKKRGLIRSKKEGRVTNYRITEKGRKGILKACEYFCKAFGEIFAEHIEAGKNK